MSFSETTKNEILEWGKKAVVELKNKNFKQFEEYAENGFNFGNYIRINLADFI